MMIGTVFPSLRTSRQTSSPLIFGSITSRMMTSGFASTASRRPAAPSRARLTAYPSYSNPSRRAATIESSSSTIRTFGIGSAFGPGAGPRGARRGDFPGRRGRGAAGRPAPQRQADRERAALTRLALDHDAAAVHLHDVLHDRQAEPASLHFVHQACSDPVETVEDLLLLGAWNADAVVAHRHDHLVALPGQPDADLLRVTRVLHRVVQQVVQRLPDRVRVDLRRRQQAFHPLERDAEPAVPEVRLERPERAVDHVAQVGGDEAVLLAARLDAR